MIGRRRAAGEEGQALLLAIVFLFVTSLIVAAILDFTDTSFLESNSVQKQRSTVYASDGAIEGAITQARRDVLVAANRDPATPGWCDQASPYFSVAGLNGQTSDITCSVRGVNFSGLQGQQPNQAILALTGNVTQSGQGTVHVDNGHVLAVGTKSSLEVKDKKGTMVVGSPTAAYSARSRAACKGKGTIQVFSPGQKLCSDSSLSTVTDPNYTSLTPPSANAVLPTCNHQNDRIEFSPGRYTDANALTNMMKKNSPCKGSVFWFKPGPTPAQSVYYFDFTNGHEWKVDDPKANVVGGVAKGGWDSGSFKRPKTPGGCDNTASGVQFIFGGNSRLTVNKGTFELCPAFVNASTDQRIAIYGAKSTTSLVNKLTAPTVFKTGGAATPSIEGTVYVPTSSIDLDTRKVLTPILTRGVIAASVKLKSGKLSGGSLQRIDPTHSETDIVLDLTAKVGSTTRAIAQVTIAYDGVTGATSAVVGTWQYVR